MATRKSQVKRIARKSAFNRVNAAWLAALMVVVGVFVVFFSRAAGSGRLYLNPSSAQVQAGNTVTLSIREDSGTAAVNAVQADLTYDTNLVDYVGVDGAGSAFGIAAPTSAVSGVVTIARGTITPVTGDQLVGMVTFRVKSGSSMIGLRSTSAIIESANNTNVMASSAGSTLSVLVTATATPHPATATPHLATPTPAVATATPVVTPEVSATPYPTTTPYPTVAPTVAPVVTATPTPNGGAAAIPLPTPATTQAGIKTTYTVDGNPVEGSTVDPSSLSDGNHTVTATTTDTTGKVVEKTTSTLKVNTKKSFWQNAGLVAKENLGTILILILIIGVVIGGFFIYRRNMRGTNYMSFPS